MYSWFETSTCKVHFLGSNNFFYDTARFVGGSPDFVNHSFMGRCGISASPVSNNFVAEWDYQLVDLPVHPSPFNPNRFESGELFCPIITAFNYPKCGKMSGHIHI